MQQQIAISTDFIEMIHASSRGDTTVRFRRDPKFPGRTAIKIEGTTREAVQAQITRAMDSAERVNGRATFYGPGRVNGGWGALGEVVAGDAR